MQDQIKLFSTMKLPLMRRTLLRGSFIAGSGIFLLFISFIFLLPSEFNIWGGVSFVVSLILIAWGLIPYKKMRALQLQPLQLIIHENFCYLRKQGNTLLTIPLESIEDVIYEEDPSGILFIIKPSPEQKVVFYTLNLPIERRGDSSFFLPHFSKASFNEVKEIFVIRN